MVTIMSVISFKEGGADGISSNASSVCMIHTHIQNLLLQNILSSRCIGCCRIFRETLNCIGIQHRIWASMIKPLGFGVDTRIRFRLRSKMQVMVSKMMMFVIVDKRTLSFIAMMTYLTQNIIFVRPVRESFGF